MPCTCNESPDIPVNVGAVKNQFSLRKLHEKLLLHQCKR